MEDHSELYGLHVGQQLSLVCANCLAPRACRRKLLTLSSFRLELVIRYCSCEMEGLMPTRNYSTKQFSRIVLSTH